MKNISVMIKPASSLCNLRCKYCFYADVSAARTIKSYGVMDEKTADTVIANIFADLEAGDRLTLAFQGGEPTLAGLDFFVHFTDKVNTYSDKGVMVSYALQTNGILLDEQWCRFLKKYNFLVGLSLDGPAVYNDANRIDAQGEGSFGRIMEAKKRMDQLGVEYNVLMTLTNQLARHPRQVWRFIEEQNLGYVQFTPCLGAFDTEQDPYALTPKRYAEFYSAIFDLWYDTYCKGRYISVKLFDDLVNLLAFGQVNACGLLGKCQRQIIVEADGSVYPCDFYVLDQFKAGSLVTDTLRTVFEAPVMGEFVSRGGEERRLCGQCPYRMVCGGGCQRMRHEVFYGPTDTVCGHQTFLKHAEQRLVQLAHMSRQQRR